MGVIMNRLRQAALAAIFALFTSTTTAAEGPSPHALGEYIGWLIACDAIPGSYNEVGRELRRAVERHRLWGYTQKDIDTMVNSLRFGKTSGGFDNQMQICASLKGNKESIESIKQLLELGR
jgi:hypothetical protein